MYTRLRTVLTVTRVRLTGPTRIFLFVVFADDLHVRSRSFTLCLLHYSASSHLNTNYMADAEIDSSFRQLSIIKVRAIRLTLISRLSSVSVSGELATARCLSTTVLNECIESTVGRILRYSYLLGCKTDGNYHRSTVLRSDLERK